MLFSVHDLTIRRGQRLISCPDLELFAGQSLALRGPSGSGKTSALLAMAGILRPEGGTVIVNGCSLWDLKAETRARWRGRSIGYVFASFHLVDALSVMDNLQLARVCADLPPDVARARALLDRLGIASEASRRVDRLSQGQMQRVALARALMNRPKVLLCDEPTAALDDEAAWAMIDLLRQAALHEGAALLVATHDRRIMDAVDTVVTLEDAAVTV